MKKIQKTLFENKNNWKTKKKHLALKEMKKIITNTEQDMRSVTLN